jgi:hypothetical protein
MYFSSHLVRLDLSGNRLLSLLPPYARAAGHILCPERQSMQSALFGAIGTTHLHSLLKRSFILYVINYICPHLSFTANDHVSRGIFIAAFVFYSSTYKNKSSHFPLRLISSVRDLLV